MSRHQWWKISVPGLAIALAAVLVVLVIAHAPRSGDEISNAAAPAWMRKLEPGEKPPQFVLFSFDGAGSHKHMQRVLPIARRTGAHFTAFLSGTYLLPDQQRMRYQGPGHLPGKASIGFGGSVKEIATRIDDLNAAVRAGHEIGTHYNGHFCQDARPGVGEWDTKAWNSELDQFFAFVNTGRRQGLQVSNHQIKGGRTPCLEGKFDQLFPALTARGMNYDSSMVSEGIAWPKLRSGVWEFPMPEVRVGALGGKKVIMMDYNLWVSLQAATEEPASGEGFRKATLDLYWDAYHAAANGNRAPLVVGNHFNDWAGGAFNKAMEQFMGEVCTKPNTICATYSEVIQWMSLQDPAQLDRWRNLPNAQTSGQQHNAGPQGIQGEQDQQGQTEGDTEQDQQDQQDQSTEGDTEGDQQDRGDEGDDESDQQDMRRSTTPTS